MCPKMETCESSLLVKFQDSDLLNLILRLLNGIECLLPLPQKNTSAPELQLFCPPCLQVHSLFPFSPSPFLCLRLWLQQLIFKTGKQRIKQNQRKTSLYQVLYSIVFKKSENMLAENAQTVIQITTQTMSWLVNCKGSWIAASYRALLFISHCQRLFQMEDDMT